MWFGSDATFSKVQSLHTSTSLQTKERNFWSSEQFSAKKNRMDTSSHAWPGFKLWENCPMGFGKQIQWVRLSLTGDAACTRQPGWQPLAKCITSFTLREGFTPKLSSLGTLSVPLKLQLHYYKTIITNLHAGCPLEIGETCFTDSQKFYQLVCLEKWWWIESLGSAYVCTVQDMPDWREDQKPLRTQHVCSSHNTLAKCLTRIIERWEVKQVKHLQISWVARSVTKGYSASHRCSHPIGHSKLENLKTPKPKSKKGCKSVLLDLHQSLQGNRGMSISLIPSANQDIIAVTSTMFGMPASQVCKISPCENPNSWRTGTVFLRFNILCKKCYVKQKTCYVKDKTCYETQNMLYVNTYHTAKNRQTALSLWMWLMMSRQLFNNADSQRKFSAF